MTDKHLSTQFDSELSGISNRVLEMGGMAESQVAQALYALTHFSGETASQVLRLEEQVNALEMEIDRDLSQIIARRQPTARDLRLLLNSGVSSRLRLPVEDAEFASKLAIDQLRKALDSFARLDATQALQVIKQDNELDTEFDGLMRKLVTYMMEDPRTISAAIDLVFVAKAIERVGDHAKNLAEQVIYIVKGADVRHTPMSDVESAVV
jgi:phosphate transport system protein